MSLYSKQNPFLASIKERYFLSKPGSQKKTQHLVLDLRDSGIQYEVGDSIGIFARHDPALVSKTLEAMRMTGRELVQIKQTLVLLPLSEFLATKGNITEISPRLLKEVFARQTNLEKKHALEVLLEDGQRENLKKYLNQHEIWDFLLAHSEVEFKAQEIVDLLMPLLPRFYSIASSQRYVGNEVHLTVAPLEYEAGGHKRRGVCTHYLCQLVELHDPSVPIFIQPSHGFRLPESPEANLLMVGPGTGIAPFRAFLQERILHQQAKGKHWLFFGEWNQAHDFYYESDWVHLSNYGHLDLSLAFSRDQAHKVYVQHKMLEQGEYVFNWLEEGAYIYVCGDAQCMAKDVEATLISIIETYGKKEINEAREYIKKLRQQKRYLRDVY